MRFAHIADTHIRNLKYHKEYREVFSQLYENLREQKPDYIMDVNDKTVVKYAQDFNTKIIIIFYIFHFLVCYYFQVTIFHNILVVYDEVYNHIQVANKNNYLYKLYL